MEEIDNIYNTIPELQEIGTLEQFRAAVETDQGRRAIFDNTPALQSVGSFDQFEQAVAVTATPTETATEEEEPKRKRGLLSFTKQEDGVDFNQIAGSELFADMVDRGLTQASIADIGIEGLNTGEFTPDDFEKINELNSKIQANPPSEEFTNFVTADNLKDKTKAFFSAPLQIMGELAGESLVSFIKSGKEALAAGAALAPLTGGVSALAGVGIASYRLEAGGTYVDTLQEMALEKDLDLSNPQDFETFFSDGESVKEARKRAKSRGLAIGLFDVITGRVAGTVLSTAGKQSLKKSLSGTGKAITIESVGGGTGEIAGQLAAGEDLNLLAAIDEAVGEIGPGGVSLASITAGDVATKTINKARHRLNFESDLAKSVTENNQAGFDAKVQEALEFKQITPKQAQELSNGFAQFSEFDASIPDSVSDKEKRSEIIQKIKQRKELESRPFDPAFTEERTREIEKVNDEIKQIAKKEPPSPIRPPTNLFAEDFQLQGKNVELPVVNAQTGQTETVKIDALQAQNTIKDQLTKLQKLKDCL